MDVIHQIWPNWTTVNEIGEGAFGKVYKVKREDLGNVSYSAVKVMHIPKDNSEINDLHRSGMDFDSIHTYFEDMVKNLLNEIQIMESLKSASNIVVIEDYQIIPRNKEIGWDIYIRMELLQDLGTFLEDHGMTRQQVLRLGMDMCQALTACEQEHIIHRDIKIDNIFFNGFHSFKLGDFGISKQLEKTQSALSQKGTNMYMAPEVFRAEKYDHTVDIYSLGIMLYRLLNKGRFPFQPPAEEQMYASDSQKAMAQRLGNAPMPAPAMADEQLSAIILKACAYHAKDRYQSARDMLAALKEYQQTAQYEGDEFVISTDTQAGKSTSRSGNASGDITNGTMVAFHGESSEPESPSKIQSDRLTPPVGGDIGEVKEKDVSTREKRAGLCRKPVMISGIVLFVVILACAGFLAVRYLTQDTRNLAKKYTTVDKLQISAKMPKGWKVTTDEDQAVAVYEKGDVYKEISYTMDFDYAAVTKYGLYCGLGYANEKDAKEQGIAPDGASDKYAQAYLAKLKRSYLSEGEDFDKILTESAIYDINGRRYYYIQHDVRKDDEGKSGEVAIYSTVQDGARIYYRLLVRGAKITKEDREILDAVMKSVQMNTEGIKYCNLKPAGYVEDIYALAEDQTLVGSAGVAVNMPAACEIKEEEGGLKGVYQDQTSYGQDSYTVTVLTQDKSWLGTLSTGMNNAVAEQIVKEQQDQGETINHKEHVLAGSHACYAVGCSDATGRSFTYYTVYRGKLLSFCYKIDGIDADLPIDGKAKKMLRSMIETASYDQ